MSRAAVASLALAAALLLVDAPSSHAFGRGRKPSPLPSPTPAPSVRALPPVVSAIQLSAVTSEGAEIALEPRQTLDLGCLRLVYGANLAACLASCDGTAAYAVSREPDYAALWGEEDAYRVSGSRIRKARGEITIRVQTQDGAGKLLPPSSPDLCSVPFDGDGCLTEIRRLLFENTDPVAAYAAAIDAADRTELRELSALLRELRQELRKHGIEGYTRQGHFLSRNLRNAPTLLCQLKSRQLHGTAPLEAPLESMTDAIREDRQEMERSLDFLRRYGATPIGGWRTE